MNAELEARRTASLAAFEEAIERVLGELREVDLADPETPDYPAGVLTGWALSFEQRAYDDDGVGLTLNDAIARRDQSVSMSASLGRWLMLDREAELHSRGRGDDS